MEDAKRILIAPTALKGTLSASDAARALAAGWRSARPHDDLLLIPIGDGGDGSLEMLEAALHAQRLTAPARDALGRVRNAPYVVLPGDLAFIETASVVGMAMLRPGELDVMRASTAGLGDLILRVIESGLKRIAVGIGGTSSQDVGIGMLAALGAGFEGVKGDLLGGRHLEYITGVDLTNVRQALSGVEFIAVCDVECPLIGPQGAAARFAAQKGASDRQIRQLDEATRRFADIVARDTRLRIDRLKHSGAGGGLAAGFWLGCRGKQVDGGGWLIGRCGFEQLVGEVDVVVVGEGKFDETSLQGKAAYRLAKLARAAATPVYLAAGVIDMSPDTIHRVGFTAIACGHSRPQSKAGAVAGVTTLGANLANAISEQS